MHIMNTSAIRRDLKSPQRRVVLVLVLALFGILWSSLQVTVFEQSTTQDPYRTQRKTKSDGDTELLRWDVLTVTMNETSLSPNGMVRRGVQDTTVPSSFLSATKQATVTKPKPRVVGFTYDNQVLGLIWTRAPRRHNQTNVVSNETAVTDKDKPYPAPVCVPAAEWQAKHYPTCNLLHEVSWNGLYDTSRSNNHNESSVRHLGFGFASDAWRIGTAQDTIVLKTLRYHRPGAEFDIRKRRVEATIMERLTASPHVIDLYAYCSTSGLVEYADGGDLSTELEQSFTHMTALRKLQIAVQAAQGLAGMHTTDFSNRSVLIHRDIKADQFIKVNGRYKLNDFNMAAYASNCSMVHRYVKNQESRYWAPEIYRREQFTEAIDVFSFGNVLFTLLEGRMPYQDHDREDAVRLLKQGTLANMSQAVWTTRNPILKALRNSTDWCRTMHPEQRPTMPQVRHYLESIWDRHAPEDMF